MNRPSVLGGRPVRTAAALAVGVLLLVAAGCATADPQNVFSPASDLAAQIGDLFAFIIYIAAGVFVVVEAGLIWALVRFRARAGQARPAQVHGNTSVEIGWTIAPAIILAVIAVPTVITIFRTYSPPPPDALTVKVVGHQWWWEVQYPAERIVAANEIHVPAGRAVRFTLESADVIHSFWVPRLAGKRDMIPGRTNELWFIPSQPGTFDGQCAEFCGTQHAGMRLQVVVEPTDAYQAWVQSQVATPAAPTGLAAQGLTVFRESGCIACHAVQGVSEATVGPNLTHVASRQKIAAASLDNTPEGMRRWLRNPQEVKPGNLMPRLGLADAQLDALVAYLGGLK